MVLHLPDRLVAGNILESVVGFEKNSNYRVDDLGQYRSNCREVVICRSIQTFQ